MNNCTIRLATPEEIADPLLEQFDHTKLSAYNTCPTWGLLRYGMHKQMPYTTTAQALLAGGLLHECFSVIRAVQLNHVQAEPWLAIDCIRRLFEETRAEHIIGTINANAAAGRDVAAVGRAAALVTLETGEWVDDPYDTRRTYTALETSLLYYSQRWDYTRYPIVVWERDGRRHAGIELPFALYVHNGISSDIQPFLLTGRADGLHLNGRALVIQDNKTGARLDNAWAMSFETSHQMTGYMVAAAMLVGQPCDDAHVLGLQIPLPRNLVDGYQPIHTHRAKHQFDAWERWMLSTVSEYRKHKVDILNAPMYTHSCNRYFRPCSMIPYCVADDDEKRQIISEMTDDRWTPLREEQRAAQLQGEK